MCSAETYDTKDEISLLGQPNFAPWETVARVKRMETGLAQPVLDLTPDRHDRFNLRQSISFRSWEGEESMSSKSDKQRGASQIRQRNSDDVNNLEDEGIRKVEDKIEALRHAAKLNLLQEMLPESQKQSVMENETEKRKKACFKHESLPVPVKAPRKLLELILMQQDISSEDTMSESLSPKCAKSENHDNGRSNNSLRSSGVQSPDAMTVISHDTSSQDMSCFGESDFDANSLGSIHSKGVHHRTWSTEPLDSFLDGTQSKARCLRNIGNKTKFLTEDDICTKMKPSLSPAHDSLSNGFSFRKISDPSRRNLDNTNASSNGNNLPVHQSSSLRRKNFCRGLLNAGKCALQSVWTWALVAVILAGVHVHRQHSGWIYDGDKILENDDPFDFEWDDNVDFDSHDSDED